MKKIVITICIFVFGLIQYGCKEAEQIQTAISEGDITAGLKEALSIGASNAGAQLSTSGGYFLNDKFKILLPDEARVLIDKVFKIPVIGVGANLVLKPLIDSVVYKMNSGAEYAAKTAAPIFVKAITDMTVTDGRNILLSSQDSAATNYLRVKTFLPLSSAFAPKIDSAMDKFGASTAWTGLFEKYNSYVNDYSFLYPSLGLKTINPNLGQYATEKALNGLFKKVAEEEKNIRDNPVQRTTDLLQRVFKLQDSQ